MIDDIDPRIPTASTVWQLWYSDTFDHDAPRSLQATGTDFIQGLYELWRCTLNEGILDNGNASFSRFHLTWGTTAATRVDVFVNPFDNQVLLKLRRWVGFVLQGRDREVERITQPGEEGKDAIILRLAQLHYALLQRSKRWTASAIDWDAEARELLARVELLSDPEEL